MTKAIYLNHFLLKSAAKHDICSYALVIAAASPSPIYWGGDTAKSTVDPIDWGEAPKKFMYEYE
ncbi:hypothetical protein GCM10009117_09440 [Gangjinia marincola]|uniref:Uncharacterized protein n=1 Tax=Gangjinia marincola TaxID=578463 RepID=A0ABP3XR19_9FLAO